MLGIDKGRHAAGLLGLRNHLQRNGGFAGRFRSEDFDHAPAREAAHAQRCVERNGAGGNHGNGYDFLRAQPHDGALAKLLFDLRKRQIDCFCSFVSHKNAAPFEL